MTKSSAISSAKPSRPLKSSATEPPKKPSTAKSSAPKLTSPSSPAVATNAEPANVDFVLDRANLRHHFRAAIDGHQVTHPKPHPEIYLKAAQALGVPPANCVIFEDSMTGVQAGLAAGIRVVGITTTHHELPGVSLLIPNFLHPSLETWLARSTREGIA
jgi:beta-phosphoglucomutase-like phosphatase (HAD superfamily)